MSSTSVEQLQPLLPLLARMLGHRPSPATVWRWTAHGIKSGDRRVKLRAVKIGGRFYATPNDVQHFIDEQNPPAVEVDEQPERSPETQRQLAAEGLL
jgi:hypothetical protein